MTHEQRATWIKRIFLLVLAMAVVAGVWSMRQPQPETAPPPPVAVEYDLELTHYHRPGDADSEQIAHSLNRIAEKYREQVLVTRIDITKPAALTKSAGIEKAPHVVFTAGGQKSFEFQGLWAYPKIEFKVEEILRGLRRVGKDWLPEVKGMQPAGKAKGGPPSKP